MLQSLLLLAAIALSTGCADNVLSGGLASQGNKSSTPSNAVEALGGAEIQTLQGTIGKDEGAIGLRLTQMFLDNVAKRQTFFPLSSFAIPQTFTLDNLDIPCITKVDISGLRVDDIDQRKLAVALDDTKQRMIISYDGTGATPVKVRGSLAFENTCKITDLFALPAADVGSLIQKGIDLAGLGNGIPIPGLGGAAPITIPAGGVLDLFKSVLQASPADPQVQSINIFDPSQVGQLDALYGVTPAALGDLQKTLGTMPLADFLNQQLFHIDAPFEIELRELKIAVPLTPQVLPNNDLSMLNLALAKEDFTYTFTPALTKFGIIPKAVLELMFQLIFPKSLTDALIEKTRAPAADIVASEVAKAMQAQLNYLKGDFGRPEFDGLFAAAETIGAWQKGLSASGNTQQPRNSMNYLMDFKDAHVASNGLELALNAFISSTQTSPCLQGFAEHFSGASSPNAQKTAPAFGPAAVEAFLSANIVNQALYVYVRSGALCHVVNLKEQDVIVLTTALLEALVKDLPKVGPVFPDDVKQMTVKAFLEHLGILQLVRDKPITIRITPMVAPFVRFDSGAALVANLAVQVIIAFGDQKILELRPILEGKVSTTLRDGYIAVSASDLSVGGDVIVQPVFGIAQQTTLNIDTTARKALSGEYAELLDGTVNKVISALLGKGIPVPVLDIVGTSLTMETIGFTDNFAHLGFRL